MKTALRVWYLYTTNSFQQVLANKFVAGLLLLGKILRISLFVFFLNFLFRGAAGLGGYTREQIIFFYLSFNLMDTLGQLLYRETYRFRSLVISGGLDLVLTKPVHPLIRVLLGGADLLDLIILCLIFFIIIWFGVVNLSVTPLGWLLYFFLILNGLVISTAIHIFILGLGVITTSIDHLVLIYRDLSSMLRIPADVYLEPIRSMITFVIPLGIIFTFPSQALFGILSSNFILIAIAFSVISLSLSLKFWNYSLRKYQSASS